MAGKAKTQKNLIDEIKQLKKDKAKNFGLQRQSASVYTTVGLPLGTSGSKGGSDSNKTSNYLKTEGDTMMGPIAFYPHAATIASGVLNIGNTSSGRYTSRVVVFGQGGTADDLDTISGAAFAGQLLFLQAVVTTPITLKHLTGNIFIPSGSNYTVTGKEIVVLQYDESNTTWTLVSNFSDGSGGVSLSGVNTWTGVNTFTANSFSVTSANVYLGDASSDTINLTGTVNINGDIDMNTYDINAIDRLKFSTTAGSGSALTSSDTGLESLYSGGLPYGLLIQFPSTNSAVMQIKRGTTEMINISSVGMMFGGPLSMNTNKITNLGTPTSSTDAATKAYVDSIGGVSLSGTNTWTGVNTFTGTSHSITSANIYIGDASSDNIYLTGDVTFSSGDILFNDNITIGDSAADQCYIYSDLDFKTNTAASTINFYSLYSEGYITIKVNGVNKRLYYFAG